MSVGEHQPATFHVAVAHSGQNANIVGGSVFWSHCCYSTRMACVNAIPCGWLCRQSEQTIVYREGLPCYYCYYLPATLYPNEWRKRTFACVNYLTACRTLALCLGGACNKCLTMQSVEYTFSIQAPVFFNCNRTVIRSPLTSTSLGSTAWSIMSSMMRTVTGR